MELYERSEKVISICAHRDTNWLNNGNISFSKFHPAYGYGTWFTKKKIFERQGEDYLLNSKNYKINRFFSIFIHNGLLFKYYVKYIICGIPSIFTDDDGNVIWCDSMKSIYLHLSEYLTVVPAVSKSRTWGNDGSGEHMPNKKIDVKCIELDKAEHFEYDTDLECEFLKKNYRLGSIYLDKENGELNRLIGCLYYLIYVLCGKRKERVRKILLNRK